MKAIALTLLVAALAGAVGCQPGGQTGAAQNLFRDAKGDLAVELSMPYRAYTRGDVIPLAVTVQNAADKEMSFNSDSQAKVTIIVSRNTPSGWEEVKRYPASLVKVPLAWKLAAKGSEVVNVNLTVPPDWPTAEDLRLTAWVNGQPDVKPSGVIRVYAARRDCDKARVYFGPQP